VLRSLDDNYLCDIDNIPLSGTISLEEIIAKSNVLAIDETVNIFERFNWFNVSRKALEEEQDKLLKRDWKSD
jgi:hypothetical protein